MDTPPEDQEFEALRARYLRTYTAALTDALDRRGLHHQWLGPDIKPLVPGTRLFGWAFTVRWRSHPEWSDPDRTSARMLDALLPDYVAVLDTGNNPEVGYWGELCCTISLRQRVRGVVVDGGLRDAEQVLRLGFPAFCRFTSPLEASGRSRIVRYQQPIRIGQVTVEPGDAVFGDLGGVVIVPRGIVRDLLAEVEGIRLQEDRLRGDIVTGITADQAMSRYGRI